MEMKRTAYRPGAVRRLAFQMRLCHPDFLLPLRITDGKPGHVLLEDVPGVGKTSLAGVLAKTTSCSFGRIYGISPARQFTADRRKLYR